MADITWANVTNFDSELSTVHAVAQTDILAYVNDHLDVSLFGGESSPKVRILRIYLASHMGTVLNRHASGASGPVTSLSAGGLSKSFGSMASTSALGTTSHGQMYLDMVNMSAARSMVSLLSDV